MNYEIAIKKWGAKKLNERWDWDVRDSRDGVPYPVEDLDTVSVEFSTYDIGYCETCSQEVSSIYIEGTDVKGKKVSTDVTDYEDNFGGLIKEIVEAGSE